MSRFLGVSTFADVTATAPALVLPVPVFGVSAAGGVTGESAGLCFLPVPEFFGGP